MIEAQTMVRRSSLVVLGGMVLAAGGFWVLSPRENCPPGSRSDPARAERLEALLSETVEGQAVLDASGVRANTVCFADNARGVLGPNAFVVLPSRAQAKDNAARLGHLLLHLVEGPPTIDQGAAEGCEARVDLALRAEARGHALELRLRRELDVIDRLVAYPFEARLRAASAAEQERVILEWFRDHPAGSPAVPGFAEIFTEQCAGSP